MSILFVASEVGSVRALLPLCRCCEEKGISFSVLNRGYMGESALSTWIMHENYPEDISGLASFLEINDIKVLVFSVNVKDTLPLKVARAADRASIPTIHILDYWNGYKDRMRLDKNKPLKPTVYVVPDEYARQKAVKEGVEASVIQVMGQPAFTDTIAEYENTNNQALYKSISRYGFDLSEKLLLFVSEPVVKDQGESCSKNPDYRGYTEKDSLAVLVNALKMVKSKIQVCVLPHPREDVHLLKAYWKSIGGEKYGKIIQLNRGRDLLPFSFAVAGMSSTLLYEAWLLGIPVMSIQPGLRNESLKMITEREDVFFLADKTNAAGRVSDWIETKKMHDGIRLYREENYLHQKSVNSIYQLICSYLDGEQK